MKVQITVIHEGRSYTGEAELATQGSIKRASQIRPEPRTPSTKSITKPADAIGGLYVKGFFSVPRSLAETMQELGKEGYNFGKSSVATVLSRADYLQVKGAKGSYTYVQKYPPSPSS